MAIKRDVKTVSFKKVAITLGVTNIVHDVRPLVSLNYNIGSRYVM